MAGRFGQANIARDHRAINLVAEVIEQLLRHLLRQSITRVIHGAQQAFDFERRVQVRTHFFHGLHQIRQTFQRVIFALHRYHHGVRCGQTIHREQIQRGRTIDQHKIVFIGVCGDSLFEPRFTMFHINHFNFGAGKFAIGRNNIVLAVS